VNIIIIVTGIVGLSVAAYALIDITMVAGRRRLLDLALVIAAAAATVVALLTWGDRLLQ
jgi:hypothetical protein